MTTITEADQQAAQDLCASGWTYAGLAFARHRQAALATARAEAEALRSLLAEIVPPRLIGESHDPYPEGKTTILMDWDWLKRTRAALLKGPTQ